MPQFWVSLIQGKLLPNGKVTCFRGRSQISWNVPKSKSIAYYQEGNGTPLQYSCLENPMDRGAWWAAVHGVARSRARLSDFTFTFHFHALEKEMATHSSVLAWRIPGTGEPGGLLSLGSHRVGHDWSDFAAAVGVMMFLVANSTVSWCSKSPGIYFKGKKWL